MVSRSRSPVRGTEILVKPEAGDAFSVVVRGSCSIRCIKEQIKYNKGIPPNQQLLVFGYQSLDDNGTVAGYDIQAGAVLKLYQLFDVVVRRPNGEQLDLTGVHSQYSIEMLKYCIWGKTTIPPNQLQMTLGLLPLDGARRLACYNISSATEITMVVLCKKMTIHRVWFPWDSFTVDLDDGDTLADIKVKIRDKEGIPPDQMVLSTENGGRLLDSALATEVHPVRGLHVHLT